MVTLQDFIHRLRCQNHLNVSITDSGSERVKDGASQYRRTFAMVMTMGEK